MLCKVASGTVSWNTSASFNWSWSIKPTLESDKKYKYGNGLPGFSTQNWALTTTNLSISIKDNYVAWSDNVILTLWSTQIYSWALTIGWTKTINWISYTIPANTNPTLYIQNSNSSSTRNVQEFILTNVSFSWSVSFTISKTVSTHKSKPRQLKAIWEKATCTLFGYHIDNTRYAG